MAPEEAIKYLRQIYPNGYHCWLDSQRIEAIEMAIMALSKPSLPSNLDEAADDGWALYEYRESPKGLYSTCYIDGFKAGAEWMAGQGINAESEVCKLAERAWVTPIDEKQLQRDLYDNFVAGDKVVVQIRKKQ